MKVDIAIICETKIKLRAITALDEYIMISSEAPQAKHASEGVAISIKKELK